MSTGSSRPNEEREAQCGLNIHGAKIEAEMLLDTGASVTVISKQLYAKGNALLHREKPEWVTPRFFAF